MVRIIAGYWKGRRIKTTEGEGYRPAMGKVREALFSMLTSRGVQWEAVRVLDVFAGSGSLGWEALSRGAREVCFLEKDPRALRLLRDQAVSFFRAEQRVRILPGDAMRILAGAPKKRCGRPGKLPGKESNRQSVDQPNPGGDMLPGYDVLFFDPPYGRDLLNHALTLADGSGWIASDALVCVEVEAGWSSATLQLPGYALETERLYGQTRIILWKKTTVKNESPSIPAPLIP